MTLGDCTCPEIVDHPSDCTECIVHAAEAIKACEDEQRAEEQAENAWLVAAEYDPHAEYDPQMHDPREWQ
ncbi:MAG: hypothetical protein H0U53_11060 [Actinobacteria bacterium]|nr:hypothetical protein [Actinomycetota bacterium]